MAEIRPVVFVRILLLIGISVGALGEMDEDEELYEPSPEIPDCPENEVWKTCHGNCSDCTRRGSCPYEGCAAQGCDCAHNFARVEPGGPCLPVHLCPVPEACGENESFRECGPVCELCGGMRCRMLQCEHRCYCNQGHLRDRTGKCVPQESCPKKSRCTRDEAMGTSGRVDEYCLRDGGTSNETETSERCYCEEGHSRNSAGHCVKEEMCKLVVCADGEEYQSCPRKCRVTCGGDPLGECQEDGQCFPGCFCREGRLADDWRRCVDHCPPAAEHPNTLSPDPTQSWEATDSLTSPHGQVSSSIPSPATPQEESTRSSGKEVVTGETETSFSPSTTSPDQEKSNSTTTSVPLTTILEDSQLTTILEDSLLTTISKDSLLTTEPETTKATAEPTLGTTEEIKDEVATTAVTNTRPSEDDLNEEND